MKCFTNACCRISFSLALVPLFLLFFGASSVRAQQLYDYSYVGPTFDYGVGPNYASSFASMNISLSFVSPLITAPIEQQYLPSSVSLFTMSDGFNTTTTTGDTTSSTGGIQERFIIDPNASGVPVQWVIVAGANFLSGPELVTTSGLGVPYVNVATGDASAFGGGNLATDIPDFAPYPGNGVSAQPGMWNVTSLGNIYTAIGLPEAPTYLDPQPVTGDDIIEISGDIGGADTVNDFSFYWPGGDLSLTELDDPAFLSAQLFQGTSLTSLIALSNNPTLIDSDLSPGNYVLQLTNTSSSDPPYGILFNDPISSPTSVPSSVPEPCTLLLFGSGLLGLVGFKLRKKLKR